MFSPTLHVLILVLVASSLCIDIALNLSDAYYVESQHIRTRREDIGAFKSYTHTLLSSRSDERITYAGVTQEGLPSSYQDVKVYYFKHDRENEIPLLLVVGSGGKILFFTSTSACIDKDPDETETTEKYEEYGKDGDKKHGGHYVDYKDTNVDYEGTQIPSGESTSPRELGARPKVYAQRTTTSRRLSEFKEHLTSSLLSSLESDLSLHSNMWVQDDSITSKNMGGKLVRIAYNSLAHPIVLDISSRSDYSIDGALVNTLPWTVHVKKRVENDFEIYTHRVDRFLFLAYVKCDDQILPVSGHSYYNKVEVHYPVEKPSKKRVRFGSIPEVPKDTLPILLNLIRGKRPLYYVKIGDSLVQLKESDPSYLSSNVLSHISLDLERYGVKLSDVFESEGEIAAPKMGDKDGEETSREFKFYFGPYSKLGQYIARVYDPESIEGADIELISLKAKSTPGITQATVFLKNGKKLMVSIKYDGKEYFYDSYSEYIAEAPLENEGILEILECIGHFGRISPRRLKVPITRSIAILFDLTRHKSYSSDITGYYIQTSARYFGAFKIVTHTPEVIPFTVQAVRTSDGTIKAMRFMGDVKCTKFEAFYTTEAQLVTIECGDKIYCMLKGMVRWVIFKTSGINDIEAIKMIREQSHGTSIFEEDLSSPEPDDVFEGETVESAKYLGDEKGAKLEERKCTPCIRGAESEPESRVSEKSPKSDEEDTLFSFSPDAIKRMTLED